MSLMVSNPSYNVEIVAAAITAVPTTVAVANADKYYYEVDTSGGAINFTTLAAITGIKEGAVLNLTKTTTDANAMTFTDPTNGVAYTFDTQGDVLCVQWNGAAWHITG